MPWMPMSASRDAAFASSFRCAGWTPDCNCAAGASSTTQVPRGGGDIDARIAMVASCADGHGGRSPRQRPQARSPRPDRAGAPGECRHDHLHGAHLYGDSTAAMPARPTEGRARDEGRTISDVALQMADLDRQCIGRSPAVTRNSDHASWAILRPSMACSRGPGIGHRARLCAAKARSTSARSASRCD